MGRLTQTVDSGSGAVSQEYDGLNRLISETTPQGSVSYVYDTASRRSSMTVAGQTTVAYVYDDANRLTQITKGAAQVGFTYDTAQRRAATTLPSGIVATYNYDDASQLVGIAYTRGAILVGDLQYNYDVLGNRTGTTGSMSRTNLPAAMTTATYNQANQLTSWNGTTITYDDNGNMLSDGVRTYVWDARNRLASISGPTSASFQYDAFGRRNSKTVAGVNTSFLYDGLNPVQELNGSTPVANLITGSSLDEFFQRTDSGGSRDLLTDALGTVIALADSTGSVQTSYNYEPFGNASISGSTNGNSYQYTGRDNDGTGIYYYRARYYDPRLQRFISSDPIWYGGGPNLYAYVGNGPTRWMDPYGLERYNKPPPDTIPPTGDTHQKIKCMEECLGQELLITGGQEAKGHVRKSLHPKNRAIDIPGPPHNPGTNDSNIFHCALRAGFTHGWWEDYGNPNKDHWHLQVGPGAGVPPIPGRYW